MDILTKSYFDSALASIMKNVATKEDLKGFATKEDLENFATKEDLKAFATKKDLENFATIEYLDKRFDEALSIIGTTFKNLENKIDNDRFEIRERLGVVEQKVDQIIKVFPETALPA